MSNTTKIVIAVVVTIVVVGGIVWYMNSQKKNKISAPAIDAPAA